MKKDQPFSELLIALALALMLVPFEALVQAHMLAQLWGWFVAPQYGNGPTLAAWYGFSTILSIMLYRTLSAWRVTAEDGEVTWKTTIKRELTLWFTYALLLGMTWMTGTLLHWIA